MATAEPRRSSRRALTTTTVSYAELELTDASTGSASPPPQTPARKTPTRGKKDVPAFLGDDEYGLHELHTGGTASETDSPLSALDDSDVGAPSPAQKKKKRASPTKKKAVPKTADEQAAALAKRPRKPKVLKPEKTYVIPDVERKSTTFRGRLGYACLNTILRNRKPADFAVFCSRTCRIDTIKEKGAEWPKELGLQNVRDMLQLIEWNEQNNIRFMRMSSEMFPFASHPEYGYSLEYAAPELAAVGALANKYGHRLTTHPGQFTQLGSPRKEVVRNAVRDLRYHCEMIDRMGLGRDSVMIIHGGGMFGDKPATLARIRETYTTLLPQNVKDRLVLENDEMCYSAEDLLPLCEELQIPLVFDYHHDWILPSSIGRAEVIRRANAIFAAKGIKPKQHLSEPRPGAVTIMERRAHSDRCQTLPDELPDDMDLMIEAKDKEQAVLHLYRMYDLHPVTYESLRPPAEVESTQTKGRKSHKPAGTTGRKKAAASGIVADEDDVKGEDPAVVENVDGTEHAELGPDAKAEEHACPSPVKKKRAPKKVKLEADGEEKAMPVPKKRAPRKTKANAEPVDQVLAELPAPPEAMDAPILDAAEQAGVAAAEPSPAKKRKTTRKGKAAAAAVPAGCANADVDADVESKADEDLPVVRPRAKRTASGKAKAAH